VQCPRLFWQMHSVSARPAAASADQTAPSNCLLVVSQLTPKLDPGHGRHCHTGSKACWHLTYPPPPPAAPSPPQAKGLAQVVHVKDSARLSESRVAAARVARLERSLRDSQDVLEAVFAAKQVRRWLGLWWVSGAVTAAADVAGGSGPRL
jgi:hypothetical protein